MRRTHLKFIVWYAFPFIGRRYFIQSTMRLNALSTHHEQTFFICLLPHIENLIINQVGILLYTNIKLNLDDIPTSYKLEISRNPIKHIGIEVLNTEEIYVARLR